MGKQTLSDVLLSKGHLESKISADSNLVSNLEIYGFVNSAGIHYLYGSKGLHYNLFVNLDNEDDLIISNILYQGSKDHSNIVFPIYSALSVTEKPLELPLSKLHVPSLMENTSYLPLRRSGYQPRDTKTPFSPKERYKKIDQEWYMLINSGEILLLDVNGKIQSVGEDIIAICRYLSKENGSIQYTKYRLDELFINIESQD